MTLSGYAKFLDYSIATLSYAVNERTGIFSWKIYRTKTEEDLKTLLNQYLKIISILKKHNFMFYFRDLVQLMQTFQLNLDTEPFSYLLYYIADNGTNFDKINLKHVII